ncbi:MAG: FAD binding domain-containing protein [Rhodospirillaceae bacterium]|nr:FAD binding domain-containing protein [Rhodospirillaceae bacterium]
MGVYLQPTDLEEALQALGSLPLTILAGGTDIYPARVERPFSEDILDISRLEALRRIEEHGDHWRVGAGVTWTQLLRAPLPPCFDGLKAAAREVGGMQIQNAGTVCGNVCNASPAADGVPNLLALDAAVELASARGRRSLPVADFILGNRRTRRAPDELVTALLVPRPREPARSAFLKLGARRYLVISIVMVAGVVEAAEDGTVAAARLAVGACSEVARRLPALEAALAGLPLAPGLEETARPEHLAELAPIDDVRAPAAYRRDAALELVRRLIRRLAAAT